MNAKTFIPNGSIVLLNGGNKKLMIYGRKQLLLAEEKEEMYDYLAVPYPEGYINPDYSYVFNEKDIAEIIHKGYSDQEEKEFQKVLNEV
ncbi:DUF4176 domain-containing protein [Alkalihalophilus pseudofirmus]|uniref:DUF4176 domain-containing protein n=1 Tax=Alkalihalophilus pseudofirmus TaxID=79885 RepID=UPI00259BE23D|nr:DUF4176 domain-containing protein [Alkalihalophilus pseudofirmus]WEG15246.1 DUF4176 domain-containing protein [Alkalihalophilus pseudofirmus]